MRIAVFHNLPSGGAKRALHGFVKQLKLKGHEIDLFVPSTADETFLNLKPLVNQTAVIPVQRSIAGMVVSTWKYVIPVRFSAADLEETHRKLANIINEGNYDITFVEQDRYTLSPFILRYLRHPSIYYCPQPSRLNEKHLAQLSLASTKDTSAIRYARKLWKSYLRRKLPRIDRENARWAKYILANSTFSQETIREAYGLNAYVSHLGVDPQIFRPLGLHRENYVLSVGSMEPSKGYDFLIGSLSVLDEGIRPKLVIVSNSGNERYSAWIERLAHEKGVLLEQKRLISDAELVDLYNRACVFVYAPYSEPFGLGALEAMACGTPVVAVREGGVRDTVVHEKTGILTERDEKTFSTAIEMLLRDKNMQDVLRKKALDSIGNYWNIQQAAERLLDHMKSAIALQKI